VLLQFIIDKIRVFLIEFDSTREITLFLFGDEEIPGLSVRGGTRYFYLPKMVFGTS
jgi:hypothetical protein